MSLSSITAIVPILCVTAAGIAAMLAEAFREPGERMPIAGLGLVGLMGAAIAPRCCGAVTRRASASSRPIRSASSSS